MPKQRLPKHPRKLRRLNSHIAREAAYVAESVTDQYFNSDTSSYDVTAKIGRHPLSTQEYLSRVGHTATEIIRNGLDRDLVTFDHEESVALSTVDAGRLIFRAIVPAHELVGPRVLGE